MSASEPVGAWAPGVREARPHPGGPAPESEPATGPVITVAVTCVEDGQSHAVPDTELTGPSACSGFYRAVCGHVVSAAPMVAPEGEPCRQCLEARQAANRSRRGRRRGLRLLRG
ncbi:hypothetical protein SAMN05443637_101345 [Pseudonocardia thermophila]|jgi:hypothetical protein|uniref:Uncharacterized protein n=1 Tax=Pseudonocardia thermophila TaxID=1848 RepID=A0A1M6NMN2_PSETH|nr:hypothetical protein [Pseudonocardia thermophila]SHJ96884.1 hypothetical protein SAMN05443637_101345 [Pseudonocardia thermophila]